MSSSNQAISMITRTRSTISDTEPNESSMVAMATSTAVAVPNRARTTSDFDLSNMPHGRIFQRTPHQWSVHLSPITSNWIATITRPGTTDPQKAKYVQFAFGTEKEARKFCKCYAHPKFCLDIQTCMLCGEQPKARHCRNCGASICGRCTTRWGARMVPKTYMNGQPSLRVSVCKSCDWLSNAFCMALLQGRFQDVQQIYQTGNVNLRTSFADIHKEAMYVCCILCVLYCARVSYDFERKMQALSVLQLVGLSLSHHFVVVCSSQQVPGPLRCHGWRPGMLAVAR
jgi:hypothetical protein